MSLVPRLCVTAIAVVDPSPILAAYLRTTTAVSMPTVSAPTLMPVPAPTAKS